MLTAGTSIYIEILHKEAIGGDNLAVGWQTDPDGAQTPISVIPVNVLSLFGQPNARWGNEMPTVTVAEEVPGLMAYPNPFTEQLTVEFTSVEKSPATVNIFDATGILVKEVFAGVVESGETKTLVLDATSLKPGVYILKLTRGSRQVSYIRVVHIR